MPNSASSPTPRTESSTRCPKHAVTETFSQGRDEAFVVSFAKAARCVVIGVGSGGKMSIDDLGTVVNNLGAYIDEHFAFGYFTGDQ